MTIFKWYDSFEHNISNILSRNSMNHWDTFKILTYSQTKLKFLNNIFLMENNLRLENM